MNMSAADAWRLAANASNLDVVKSRNVPSVHQALREPRWILLALCSVAFLPTFAALIVAASLPRMAIEFGIAENWSGLLLASNLFGLAVGFLIGGPVQSKFGAALSATGGMGLLAALAALTPQVRGFESFLFLRLLQALAAGVSLCTIGPIVRMSWKRDPVAATKANVAIAASTGLGPLLGLPAGALLEAHADWRVGMLVVAVMAACVALVAHVFLRPGQPVATTVIADAITALQPVPVRFTVPAFAIVGALSLAVVYSFMTVAPTILLTNWHVSQQKFALLVSLPPAGMLVAGCLARAALAKGAISISVIGPLAAVVQFAAGLGFLGVAVSENVHVWPFVACGVACAAANALLLAYSMTLALRGLPQNLLGRGSALVGSMHMLGAGVGSAVVSTLAGDSRLALCCVVLVTSVVNAIVVWRLRSVDAT